MAVTQISRLQNRRGLRIDLPDPLNDAEFGWAENTRELFIGEGPFFGGNTQILTQHTPASLPPYTYISNTGFDAITGFDPFGDPLVPDANFPTIRDYQQKFDDIVSVKDYGAVGDGLIDDTGAILRAVFDIYDETTSPDTFAKRRALYFPAGTYRVTKFIPLYPFSTLFGDGKTKTRIFLDTITPAVPITFRTRAVARTVDSLGQDGENIGVDIGAGTGILPQNIVVRGISFESNTVQTQVFDDKDIIRIERAQNISFNDCEFAGTWIGPANPFVGGSRGIVILNLGELDSEKIPQNISFLNCSFRNTAFAFNLVEEARNIYVFNSTFKTHYAAIKLGINPILDVPLPIVTEDINLFRASHCRFANDIVNSAFDIRTLGRGNISTYNVYEGIYTGAAGTAAIVFGGPTAGYNIFDQTGSVVVGGSTKACVSIGDTFPDMTSDVTCANKLINPRIQNASSPNKNIVMNAQDLFQIPEGFCGNILIDGDLTVTGDIFLSGSIISAAAPFSATAIGSQVVETVDYADGNVIYYEYGMRLGSAATGTYRVGTLSIIHNAEYDNGTGAFLTDPDKIDFTDNFNELNGPFADPPVELIASLDNTNDLVEITVTVGGATTTPIVVGIVRVQKV